MKYSHTIKDNELVARILNQEWIVDGVLSANAFALRDKETYISVNRLSVFSFLYDVCNFIRSHAGFKTEGNTDTYQRAVLEVGHVRSLSVCFKQKQAKLSIEVEPRASHYRSHAGVFTRVEGKNLKGGMQGEVIMDDGQVVSYEDIRIKVQYALLSLAKLEVCQLPDTESFIDSCSEVKE